MGSYVIKGRRKLSGEIGIQGAKNGALPILAASVLADGVSVIHNCPKLSDIDATIKILEHLGCKTGRDGSSVTVDSTGVSGFEIPESLMREMRSSIIFLGAILSKTGKALMSSPGGCDIGQRPIDMHLDALRKMGAEIEESHGKLNCVIKNGKSLKGTAASLYFPSVGATENIMIAGSVADGATVIHNAAREPEIVDLADYLNKCGADIQGAGEGVIKIEGVKSLRGAEHRVIPDRIAAATYLTAAAATGGNIILKNIVPAHILSAVNVFEQAGCTVDINQKEGSAGLKAPERLKAVKNIMTMPYPGFPTDMQAPIMAMTSAADGVSMIIETIFDNRFNHAGELAKMGAKITIDNRMAVVEGAECLTGANVISPDLRGGSALVLAGLAAEGETKVSGIKHIDRGYEDFDKTLMELGADIIRS
ncbi:MAG: UDP-N-acetylglucosamine 1-carboxyvinyltransferase [Oscillospiraceae bacterium]|nr:UDP-N-acetylglucosamine 1-carboxyvinyltransferase [Oscillospiraceae bacterium]